MTGGGVGGLVSWLVVSGMRGRESKRARGFADIEMRVLGLLSLRVGVVGLTRGGSVGRGVTCWAFGRGYVDCVLTITFCIGLDFPTQQSRLPPKENALRNERLTLLVV